MAACAIGFLIASHTGAASQAVDPGWQLVYAGQPGYGSDGLMESVFGDGTGQPIVARAYPLPPANFQQQTATSESAPVYYQQAPVPARQAAPVRPAPAFAQPSRAYQPAPVYGQQAPAPAARAFGAPVYYQAAPAQPIAQPAPVSTWRGAPAPQPDPRYTGSVPAPQARGFLSAPAAYRATPTNYQAAPAPPAAAYQPPVQYQQIAPQQRVAFGYETQQQQYGYQPQQGLGYAPQQGGYQQQQQPGYGSPSTYGDAAQQPVDPRYERQVVDYRGSEPPGTVIIDTPHFYLYLVLDGGRALRYGIGVGRPGFTWAGVKSISAKREWPDWHPPDEMLARRPDLPRYMPGGPDNPLGARALYLGSTLYRIHGSNEPWSIGTQVSSGCIRLRNADIVDLYGRVKVGAKVIVI
jgi:lipoprotein-anchoring transpeptidase ErfK/SrfK